MKYLHLLLLTLIMAACSNDEEPLVIIPDPTYGDIEVEVIFCENPPTCTSQNAAVDVKVYIYNSQMLQETGADESRFGMTDLDGKVRFNSMTVPTVFISVIYNETEYRSITKVPQNSLSFHRVDVF